MHLLPAKKKKKFFLLKLHPLIYARVGVYFRMRAYVFLCWPIYIYIYILVSLRVVLVMYVMLEFRMISTVFR